MSTAFENDAHGQSRWERDQRVAAEVRAEMARQNVKQTKLAREVFGKYQQWFQVRASGDVPFGALELLDIADYLHVDVGQFLAAGRLGPSPQNGSPTVALVTPYLTGMVGGGEKATAKRSGHLALVRRVA
jgi:hypothetical protein